jgi:hypothetical protein
MRSGRLLVMALNLRGPIPNAAAITSHLPDSVLLIRLNSESEKGEDMLDESYERLQAWADGTLPGLYGFDDDIDLKHTPEKPRTVPLLHPVLEVEGVSSSSKEICDEIRSICDSRGDHEVRIDASAGRKEDAAGLVRLPIVDDLRRGCTVWYTDVTSGTSVEIGGELVEDKEPPLDHMSKFWLNGSPILGARSVTEPNSLKGVLLTKVLDAIEKASKKPRNKVGLIGDLKKQGIGLLGWDEDSKNAFKHINENYDNFRFHLDGSPSGPYIDVPMTIWDRSGYWLEDIAALAIVDGWECKRIYVGVSVGDHDHENRMGCLKAALRIPHGGERLSRVWSDCHAEGMLPPEFSGLDFLDSESFDSSEYDPPPWYREKHPDSVPGKYEDNEEGIKRLAEWAAQEWRGLSPDLRNYLTPHCRNRELDVFAETSLHCLFVECKLRRGSGRLGVENKAQIDSIVASSASRGINYSILTHAQLNAYTRRVRAFDYIVPWSELRRPEEMLKSVIKRKAPESNEELTEKSASGEEE